MYFDMRGLPLAEILHFVQNGTKSVQNDAKSYVGVMRKSDISTFLIIYYDAERRPKRRWR